MMVMYPTILGYMASLENIFGCIGSSHSTAFGSWFPELPALVKGPLTRRGVARVAAARWVCRPR